MLDFVIILTLSTWKNSFSQPPFSGVVVRVRKSVHLAAHQSGLAPRTVLGVSFFLPLRVLSPVSGLPIYRSATGPKRQAFLLPVWPCRVALFPAPVLVSGLQTTGRV